MAPARSVLSFNRKILQGMKMYSEILWVNFELSLLDTFSTNSIDLDMSRGGSVYYEKKSKAFFQ